MFYLQTPCMHCLPQNYLHFLLNNYFILACSLFNLFTLISPLTHPTTLYLNHFLLIIEVMFVLAFLLEIVNCLTPYNIHSNPPLIYFSIYTKTFRWIEIHLFILFLMCCIAKRISRTALRKLRWLFRKNKEKRIYFDEHLFYEYAWDAHSRTFIKILLQLYLPILFLHFEKKKK